MFDNLYIIPFPDANLSSDKSWLAYSSLTPYVTLASTDIYNDNTIPLNFNESRLGIRCVRGFSSCRMLPSFPLTSSFIRYGQFDFHVPVKR